MLQSRTKQNPSLEILKDLAKALDVPVTELLEWTDSESSPDQGRRGRQ